MEQRLSGSRRRSPPGQPSRVPHVPTGKCDSKGAAVSAKAMLQRSIGLAGPGATFSALVLPCQTTADSASTRHTDGPVVKAGGGVWQIPPP